MHLYVFSIFSCMILPFEHVVLNVLYMNNYYRPISRVVIGQEVDYRS